MPDAIKPFGLAVKAIIADDQGRILLLRRSLRSKHWPAAWEFPGGKVDAGESLDVAVPREVEEEAGLKVVVERFVGAIQHDLAHFRVILLFFKARPMSDDMRLSHEHDEFVWTTRAELERMDLSDQMRAFLDAYPNVLS